MEGLPRMPMLSVELKFSPTSTDFALKLKEYIAQVYEENPDSYSKEIEELNQLRENAIKAPADFTGCSALKKYFAQLYLLKNRFPMEESDAAAVPFTWYEKFSDMPSPITYEDIRYELACILHNIGAVHSFLATVDSRLGSDGMKVSCTHFQCAAWAFQTMRDDAEPFRFSAGSFSADFDRNILDWYSVLMLAQAQECILEKSLIDNRKAHIIAKVAAQVSDYYGQAIKILEQPSVADVIGSSKCRNWRKFIEMKRKFYRAIAYYEMGVQADEQKKMGERLAYFQISANELTEAGKLGHKDASDAIHQALQFAEDVIMGRLNNSKKENDFIYHEKVPALESLPDLKGASLVKPVPFDPLDADVSGGDIFKRLIPLEVHRISSLYSEEKAKLLRRISESVDAKNAALDDFINSLKIDQLMLDVDFVQLPLPEILIERCAAFNAKPSAVSDLLSQMSKLTNSFQEVESIMLEAEKKLQQSDKESKDALKVVFGASDENPNAKLPNDIRSSNVIRLKAFRDELERLRKAHEQATKANAELHKALGAHSENLQTLSWPLSKLRKELPSPPGSLAESSETNEMKRLLAKIDEMKRQRDTLMEQLRQQVRDDDVTKTLLAAKDKDEQELFSKEMKKHEKQVGIIEQNLTAQDNIIKALTEANAKYGEIRKQVNVVVKQRDAKIMNLIAAYDVYVDLESKSKEGIEFYEKLKKSLQDLETALLKWRETDLEPLILKSKATLEKKATAVASEKHISATTSSDSAGPKLKDYMAYYRAKKLGQVAAFPASSVGATPSIAGPVTMTNVPSTGVPTNGYFANSGVGGAIYVSESITSYPTDTNYFNTSFQRPPISEPFPSTTAAAFPASNLNYAFPNVALGSTYSANGIASTLSSVPTASNVQGHYSSIPNVNGMYHHVPAVSSQQMATVSTTRPSEPYAPGNFGTGPSISTAVTSNYIPGPTPTTYTAPMSSAIPATMIPQSTTMAPNLNIGSTSFPTSHAYSMPPNTFMAGHQNVVPMSNVIGHQNMVPMSNASIPPMSMVPAATPQTMPYNYISLEPVAYGSDYVQLRWRYDGPKPVKYMITFRGYQNYDAGMGRYEEREVDTGAPVKLDADHYIVHNLRPDTMYAFEVSVIDEASGRIFVKSPTIRVTTNSSLL